MIRAKVALGAALSAAMLLPLAACGDTSQEKAAQPSSGPEEDTLAAVVSGAPGLTVVTTGLKTTGLANVFDGAAPYTLLAPDDDAFGALGAAGADLQQPENGAALAAILRTHILPGFVTVADIDSSLKSSQGKPVRMKTMGDTEVTFAREGEALVVTTADGASAKVDGSAMTASNGVIIPIDAVLRKLPASGSAN